ncbi:WD40 repeat domain-containing protein [Candidatus Dependentiae bacterium]
MKKIITLLLALSVTTASFAKYYLASGDGNGTIKIWNPKTWTEIKTLQGHNGGVSSVAFSPDGNFLASGSYGGIIKIWDTKTWTEITTKIPLRHNDSINSVAFGPDGKYLASGSEDKTIKIWDISDKDPLKWKEIKTLNGHDKSVNSVAFSPKNPDGNYYLASGALWETIKIWDTKTWTRIKALSFRNNGWKGVASVAFNPKGKYLASAYWIQTTNKGIITIWDTSDKNLLNWKKIYTPFSNLKDQPYLVAFGPKDNYLASADWDKYKKRIGTIKIWDISDVSPLKWKVIKKLTVHDIVQSIAFSLDGKYLASGFEPVNRDLFSSEPAANTIKIWDISDKDPLKWKEIKTLTGHNKSVRSVAFSPITKRDIERKEEAKERFEYIIEKVQPETLLFPEEQFETPIKK